MQVETTSTKRKAEDEGDESRLRAMSEDVGMNYVMICECPLEEDLPHEVVVAQVDESVELSSLWLPDERKVYTDILLSEMYPEDYRKESFEDDFEDEKICRMPERGATELEFGGESPTRNMAEDCFSDLKWNERVERDIIGRHDW